MKQTGLADVILQVDADVLAWYGGEADIYPHSPRHWANRDWKRLWP